MADSRPEELLAMAHAVWPPGWVTADELAAYVDARKEPGADVADEAVAAIYLACACVRGVAPALAAFEASYVPDLQRAASRAGLTADQATELTQRLREELLVGRAGGRPTLAEYKGRGELRGWLRITATRAAIRVKKRASAAGEVDVDRLEARAADDDPELGYMKALYRQAFRVAFQTAAASLEPEERRLLHRHSVEGLSIDALGEADGVHRATAARRLQAARDKLLAAIRREFAREAKIAPRELSSVLRLVQSRLDVTLKRLLA